MYSFMQPPDPPEEEEGERYERQVTAEFIEWWHSGVYPLRKCDIFTDAGCSEDSALDIWFASRTDRPSHTAISEYRGMNDE